jgi:DNA-binding transcriptional MerR regulator
MRIGEISERAGVPTKTIRFWGEPRLTFYLRGRSAVVR